MIFRGARHGLQLNGKLARMQKHEENILKILKAKNKGLASTYDKNDSTYKEGDNLQKTNSKKTEEEPSRHIKHSTEWEISEELPRDLEKRKQSSVKAKSCDLPATCAQPTKVNAKKRKSKNKKQRFL